MTTFTNSTTDIIDAMLQQEDTAYMFDDYFNNNQEVSYYPGQRSTSNSVRSSTREIMVDWCYRIADIGKFDSETVELAVSNLDRFLMTEKAAELGALHHPRVFQLGVITSLYSAIKIFEPAAIPPELLSRLSQGLYTVQQVERMELEMLQALDWRVNPPTAHAFVRHYLDYLVDQPCLLDDQTKLKQVEELSLLQVRLAIRDYKYIKVTRSALALCCVMNAIESLQQHHNTTTTTTTTTICIIGDELSHIANIDWRSPEFMEIQNCLYSAIVTRYQEEDGLLDGVAPVSMIFLETSQQNEHKKFYRSCATSSTLEQHCSPRSTTE